MFGAFKPGYGITAAQGIHRNYKQMWGISFKRVLLEEREIRRGITSPLFF